MYYRSQGGALVLFLYAVQQAIASPVPKLNRCSTSEIQLDWVGSDSSRCRELSAARQTIQV